MGTQSHLKITNLLTLKLQRKRKIHQVIALFFKIYCQIFIQITPQIQVFKEIPQHLTFVVNYFHTSLQETWKNKQITTP